MSVFSSTPNQMINVKFECIAVRGVARNLSLVGAFSQTIREPPTLISLKVGFRVTDVGTLTTKCSSTTNWREFGYKNKLTQTSPMDHTYSNFPRLLRRNIVIVDLLPKNM